MTAGLDKFYVDCAHYRRGFPFDSDQCARPISDEISPVTGAWIKRLWKDCASERRDGRTMLGRVRCGIRAQFFARSLDDGSDEVPDGDWAAVPDEFHGPGDKR